MMAERTTKDYAIEFGGYLATAAESFMDACNALDAAESEGATTDAELDTRSDCWRGLKSAIYEFRKRAEKAKLEGADV